MTYIRIHGKKNLFLRGFQKFPKMEKFSSCEATGKFQKEKSYKKITNWLQNGNNWLQIGYKCEEKVTKCNQFQQKMTAGYKNGYKTVTKLNKLSYLCKLTKLNF